MSTGYLAFVLIVLGVGERVIMGPDPMSSGKLMVFLGCCMWAISIDLRDRRAPEPGEGEE